MSPSMESRTARVAMVSRVSSKSSGMSAPSRTTVTLILVPTWPRILSTAWSRHRPCTGVPSSSTMKSPARIPAERRRGVVDGRDDLDDALFHLHFDAEAAELAGGVFLHIGIVDRLHIAGMRIERGQHALERGVDEFALIGGLDIFGADSVKDAAEQLEIGIDLVAGARHRLGGLGGGSLGRRILLLLSRLFLSDQRRHGGEAEGDDDSRGGGETKGGQAHERLSTLG